MVGMLPDCIEIVLGPQHGGAVACTLAQEGTEAVASRDVAGAHHPVHEDE